MSTKSLTIAINAISLHDVPTPLQQLATLRLGRDLGEFVAERRPERTWKQIANDLQAVTDISVSHESLRLWFGQPDEAAS